MRGDFDLQAPYRALVFDDVASRGCRLVDVDGNDFLDLFASFALGALGYNHPDLLATAGSEAFARAAANPTSTPFVPSESWLAFVEALQERFAPRGMDHVFCVDAGGEGVDAALKAAFVVHGERRRVACGDPADPLELPSEQQVACLANAGTDAVVVAFDGAFHGRGLGPLSATHSKVIHKADLPAFPWPSAPFPASRWPLERHAEDNHRGEERALSALERVLDAHEGRVAAVLIEPVQSEGGDRHASPGFFQGVARLVKQAGAALILDEVQTGVGISGTLWCHEQLGVQPDLVTFGKKMQLGGFFSTEAYSVRQLGRMFQTRNGDRTRAMLALATLQVIERDGLLAHVRTVGGTFLQRLQELSERHPQLIMQARGRGLLLAFDLPSPEARDDFIRRCRMRGALASYTGTRSVRLRPHLVLTEAEVDEAMDVFGAVAAEMAR